MHLEYNYTYMLIRFVVIVIVIHLFSFILYILCNSRSSLSQHCGDAKDYWSLQTNLLKSLLLACLRVCVAFVCEWAHFRFSLQFSSHLNKWQCSLLPSNAFLFTLYILHWVVRYIVLRTIFTIQLLRFCIVPHYIW